MVLYVKPLDIPALGYGACPWPTYVPAPDARSGRVFV